MYDRILIPTDGSEGIQEVLPHGIDIAQHHAATVHSIYVVDRRHYLSAPDDTKEEILASLRAEGDKSIADIREKLETGDLDVVVDVREGIPYREILAYIEENDIDLVVLGTHGRTGRDRLVHLGSVTERVLKNADIPIFVVNIGIDD